MILEPGPAAYARAAQVLREGGIVAYPTETVYGLAVDPFSEPALRALFAAKGRPEQNPVLVVIANRAQLKPLTTELSHEALRLITRFWPGPLSLVLPKAEAVSSLLTADTGNICVRCSPHPVARGLCAAFGGAITSTSANLSGQPPARTLAEAMIPGVALGIDGGELPSAAPSTIYDPAQHRVLREGAITLAEIQAVL